MRVFGISLTMLLFMFIVFVIGGKWGGGFVAKLPVIGSA